MTTSRCPRCNHIVECLMSIEVDGAKSPEMCADCFDKLMRKACKLPPKSKRASRPAAVRGGQ